MMFIALNEKTQGYDHFTFAVDSFSPHRRVLSMTRRKWFSNPLRALNSFHTRSSDRQFCKESNASNKERNSLIFFTFLYLVPTASLLTIAKLNFLSSQKLNIPGCLLLFSSKISTNKKPVCYNNDKCWDMKSVESWIWKNCENFLANPLLLHCKRRWS